MRNAKLLPFEGVRVVEFTVSMAGPVCGMMLADMGAEVIKIENPAQPDGARRYLPRAEGKPGLNRCGMFATFNRGKKDCLLDLKQPEGIEAAKRLIRISDIVIENFRPGVMDGLGLGYSVLKEIKPDLIMISLSGYGATGPDKDRAAYGEVLEAYSGLNLLIGYPGGSPKGCGPTISDYSSGILAAFASLVALHYRDLTGEGQHVDISEVETLLTCMPEAIMEFTMNERILQPQGNRNNSMAPHGCYRCKGEDQWVAIAVATNSEWENLCLVMGKPELIADKRFKDELCRLGNQDELDKLITEWTSKQTPTEIMRQLQQMNIAAAPVYCEEELHKDPHLQARSFYSEIDHPEVGKRELPGVFAKLSETPGAIRRHDPLFGEHTEWVLRELLGYTPDSLMGDD